MVNYGHPLTSALNSVDLDLREFRCPCLQYHHHARGCISPSLPLPSLKSSRPDECNAAARSAGGGGRCLRRSGSSSSRGGKDDQGRGRPSAGTVFKPRCCERARTAPSDHLSCVFSSFVYTCLGEHSLVSESGPIWQGCLDPRITRHHQSPSLLFSRASIQQ